MNWRGKALAGVLALALGMSAKGQEAVEFQGAVTYLLMPDSTLPAAMLRAFPQSMRLTFSGDDVKTEFFYGTLVGSELIYLAKDKRAYAFAPGAKSGVSLTEPDNWALAGELKKSELKEEENGTPCVSLLGLLVLGNGMQIESVGCTDPAWHLPAKANYRTGNQVLNGLPSGIVHMPIGVDLVQKLPDGSAYRIHVERSTLEPGVAEPLALPEGVSFAPVQVPGAVKRK
jgi:hypothetical protein